VTMVGKNILRRKRRFADAAGTRLDILIVLLTLALIWASICGLVQFFMLE
jgi:hypothetical protein